MCKLVKPFLGKLSLACSLDMKLCFPESIPSWAGGCGTPLAWAPRRPCRKECVKGSRLRPKRHKVTSCLQNKSYSSVSRCILNVPKRLSNLCTWEVLGNSDIRIPWCFAYLASLRRPVFALLLSGPMAVLDLDLKLMNNQHLVFEQKPLLR